MMRWLLLSWFCVALLATSTARPVDKFYEFNVTSEMINPDCSNYTGSALLVNGQLPGPAVRVTEGDRVQIKVRNQLPTFMAVNMTNYVTVHFHGIRQYNSTEADGVPFLTQRPIPPGEFFLHDFIVTKQAGTYFYHAHVGLQEQTLFGPFIIYESKAADPELGRGKPLEIENASYDEERLLVLSEWWHQSRCDFEDYLLGPEFVEIPEADTVLINGRGLYNVWGNGTGQCEPGQGGYTVLPVQRHKTYRIRVIGAATFRTFGLSFMNHPMTIIEVDGDLIKPYTVNFLEVSPGQRFSILLHANQPRHQRDYAISTVKQWTGPVSPYSNGLGVLRYVDDEKDVRREGEDRVAFHAPLERPRFNNTNIPFWEWEALQPLRKSAVVDGPPSRTIKLRSTSKVMPDGSTRWFVNDVSFIDPKVPVLNEVLAQRRRTMTRTHSGYDPHLATYPLWPGEVVDIVIQNTHAANEPCRSHPWHTHGHSHWELAGGPGEYNDTLHALRTIHNPIHKDVTLVYPLADDPHPTPGTSVGCGWSKIRIVADNPGIWAMHCHNAPHMLMGMMVALEEAPAQIKDVHVESSY